MSIRIQLDKPDMTYSPGETITGSVIISLADVCDYQNISVTFSGEGKVSWTERVEEFPSLISGADRQGPRRRPYTAKRSPQRSHPNQPQSTPELQSTPLPNLKTFYATETYLKQTIDIANTATTGDLPIGISQHPFTFTLPSKLPASLDNPIGQIRYKVTSEVNRAWYKLGSFNCSSPFVVSGCLDLQREPRVRDPVTISQNKFVPLSACYCAWLLSHFFPVNPNYGEIRFNLTLDRTGYLPGDFIPFRAFLLNKSLTDVHSCSISLIQTIKYYANGATKLVATKLSSGTGPGVTPGELNNWVADNLLAVPSPCTISIGHMGETHIIDVSYSVKFELKIGGFYTRNMIASQPIIIGTAGLS